MYKMFFKRLIDLCLSFIGIIILSPLFILISVAVKFTSKGSILFKQKRIGIYKKEFYILKFRTMRTDTPKDMPTHLFTNAQNFITPVGKFLRKTSLDELPQLFNILVGEMSIVGPRPALWNQADLIAERDKNGSNNVPVGLTGLAQINGRDELPIDIKARFDGEYAQNITFLGDIKIIIFTVLKALSSEGVQEGGSK